MQLNILSSKISDDGTTTIIYLVVHTWNQLGRLVVFPVQWKDASNFDFVLHTGRSVPSFEISLPMAPRA